MSKFSEKFKELRQSRNLSQQQLADYLHTSKSSVNMYERGEREPGLEMLEAIADYFNVDMDYLIGKSDIANRTLMPNNTVERPVTIGEKMKSLRIAKGLTQEELGEMIGVKRAAVNKWESGMVQNLKRTTIQKLAEIFDVNPATFIDGSENSETSRTAPLLSEHEVTVALAYRNHPEEQPAVDKLLGITEHGTKAPVRPNIITKNVAAFGGAETLTVDSDALDAAIERALKAKGLI